MEGSKKLWSGCFCWEKEKRESPFCHEDSVLAKKKKLAGTKNILFSLLNFSQKFQEISHENKFSRGLVGDSHQSREE